MSWEKTAIGPLASVVLTTADITLPIGCSSNAGTSSNQGYGNCLSGERVWDKAAYFLQVGAILTGTWTVEVQGTVMGITGLPIARVAGLTVARVSGSFSGTSTAPFGSSCIVLTNLHGHQSTINPTSVLFDNTSAGGLTATVFAAAKSNRGSLPRGTLNRSRVQEGVMFSIPAAGFTNGAVGITLSTTFTLGNTNQGVAGTTTIAMLSGLDQVQIWDAQMYWMDVTGASSSWNIAIQGLVPGSTTGTHFVTIAAVENLNGVTKTAFTTFGNAATIKPRRVVFDHRGVGGVSASISGTIVYAAKATRGQRHAR